MFIGHQKQWQFLKKAAQLQRLPHAFLFTGPSQIGKSKVAVEFVKLLNCERGEMEPCGFCQNCQSIERDIFPDLKVIKPKNEEIQISQVRELASYLSLRPYQGKIKSVIIDEAEKMNQEAQSDFLKMLEEPKGETLFILIANNSERLLPTIISRCERLRFYSVSQKEIEKYLQKQGVPSLKIKEICHFSFGKPGLAIELLRNPEKIEAWKRATEKIISLINSSINARFQYAKILSNDKQNLKEILENWLRFFREVLIKKVNNEEIENKVLKDYPLDKLVKNIKLIEEISFLLSTTNVNPSLALEVLLMEV